MPDNDSVPITEHLQAAAWSGGSPDEVSCGAECTCGVTFAGFDTLGEATAALERHIHRASLDAAAALISQVASHLGARGDYEEAAGAAHYAREVARFADRLSHLADLAESVIPAETARKLLAGPVAE